MTDTPTARLLACGYCYEEQGEEVHPHPECPTGHPDPETARALLHRHGLPEDVIDGALCLHAQELAAQIRDYADDRFDVGVHNQWHEGAHDAADQIDPTDQPAAASAVVAPPTDRATLSGRLARRVAKDASAVRMDLYDDLATYARQTGNAGLQHSQIRDHLAEFLFEGLLRRLAVEAHDTGTQQPAVRPARGDQFEAWLKTQRDAATGYTDAWNALDDVLDQYRLHADTGTPLGEHVCEGKVVGDCECLEPAPVAQPDRPFRDEPTEVLRHALALASVHASQAARFRPQDQDGALPSVAALFRTELQHREEQTPADEETLVHVGWWCWRGDNHGHLATMACRSDNVPIHVPAEWADEMRAVIQRIEDGDDEPAPVAQQPAAEAPEPSDPTQCSGEEGLCPEHGFHRHNLKQTAAADGEGAATPCSSRPCNPAADELCDAHAASHYHRLGEHAFCGPECAAP